MFEYFWRQQDDIPAGMGYPLFGAAHLLSVGITLALVIITVVLSQRGSATGKRVCTDKRDSAKVEGESTRAVREGIKTKDDIYHRKLHRYIPVALLILELIKDGILLAQGRFGIGYLPLHVCSIGVFVFLLREVISEESFIKPPTKGQSQPGQCQQCPGPRLKSILGEVAVILIMPASLAGLIFADWTTLYPVLNFFNLHSYLWHGLLILYPLALLISGEITPSIKHIHWVILFLCIIVPPIYIFDKLTGCNYFFINRPVTGSPLEWMAKYLGNPGYLIGYAIITILIIVFVYAIIHATRKLCPNNRIVK